MYWATLMPYKDKLMMFLSQINIDKLIEGVATEEVTIDEEGQSVAMADEMGLLEAVA
jgi:hypothetical protein